MTSSDFRIIRFFGISSVAWPASNCSREALKRFQRPCPQPRCFFFRRSSDSSVMSESMLQGEDPTFQVEVKQETFGPQVATKCCREGGSWCRRLMTKSACVGDQVKYGKILKKDLVWECSRSEKLPLIKSSVNRQCTAVWQIYSCVWACRALKERCQLEEQPPG